MYRMQEIWTQQQQEKKQERFLIYIFVPFTFRFMEFLMWCDAIVFSKKSKREKLHNIIKGEFHTNKKKNVMLNIYISDEPHIP